MYERFEDDPDLADGTWNSKDTRSLCIMLREAVDNTMGKEQSEERTEVTEEVAKMLFQPLAESTATGKHIDSIRWVVERIPELLGYIAEDQRTFQTFLADGQMEKEYAWEGMQEAIDCGVAVAWTEKNMEIAQDLHNRDMDWEPQYEEGEDDEDEEYKEEREAENSHVLAFRQFAESLDHRMYERFEDNLDIADGTWDFQDTDSLCILLREAVDNTMGKETSDARTEVAEEVTRMMFQPLAESTETGKHMHWTYAEIIGDSEKKELLEYLAKDQEKFQTFLADGEIDKWDAMKGMHKAIDCGIIWAQGDIEMARYVHNSEDEEYKEEREGESPHMLAFRQEAKMMDYRMYERFDDNLDMGDWTWDFEDTESLCILLREAVDNTVGKEQSEARTEVAEEVTKMMFQPLAESMATGKNIYWTNTDRIGDSEKQELLEYIAKDQRAFQTFLADGEMDERNAIKGMYEAVGGGMTWALGDIEMARRVHNQDMQE